MNAIARKKRIMEELQDEGNVGIQELAEELGVSSMTVRRDLAKLAKEGLITLEYGGAVLNNGALFEYSMSMKKEQSTDQKAAIARRAMEYVKDGDSVFIDAGTTTREIAKLINTKKNLNIVTNSLLAANALTKAKNLKVIMCPGVYRPTSMAYMGTMTDLFIKNFKIDTLFLAVEGVVEDGVSVPDTTDGATKATLVRNAEKVILVADSTKFGKSYFYRICTIDEIDVVITDSGADETILNQLREKGIEVIVA